MAMTTIVMRHLVARATKSYRTHGIVMAGWIATALVAAPAFLSPTSSGAVLPTSHEVVTAPARPVDDPVIPQSLGYVEFDWSAAEGGVPGFGLLPDNAN